MKWKFLFSHFKKLWPQSIRVKFILTISLVSVLLISAEILMSLVLRFTDQSFDRLTQDSIPASYAALGTAQTGAQIAAEIPILISAKDNYSRQAAQIGLQQKLTAFFSQLSHLSDTKISPEIVIKIIDIAHRIDKEIGELNSLIAQKITISKQINTNITKLLNRWSAIKEEISQQYNSDLGLIFELIDGKIKNVSYFVATPYYGNAENLKQQYLDVVKPYFDTKNTLSFISDFSFFLDFIKEIQPTSSFIKELLIQKSILYNVNQKISEKNKATRSLALRLSSYVHRAVIESQKNADSDIAVTRIRLDWLHYGLWIIGGIIITVLIPFAWFYVGGNIVKKLASLSVAAKSLAAGDLEIVLPEKRTDEIGNLSAAIHLARDTMLALKEANEQLRAREDQLRQLAITDPLTGAYNRRHFLQLAAQEIERCKRYGRPLVLAMLDIDHFKWVNDAYGHQIGDVALCQTIATINGIIRKVDVLARFGGEEFVILMPESGIKNGYMVAERIRNAIAKASITTDSSQIVRWTTSIGLTLISERDLNISDLIRRADKALYKAKENGRNRIEVG